MTDRTADILTSRWTAVPNDEIGGWALSTNGRTPASGGVMAADMVWSQEVAEHLADLHNRFINGADLDVYADSRRIRAELDSEKHQHQATRNQKDALLRELGRANDQFRDAQRDRDTFQAVARGNRRHAATLVELLERVEKFADELAGQGSVYGAEYAGRLRSLLSAPTEVERRPADTTADHVDWAVRVTNKAGQVHDLHADDPFTDRSIAEQYAAHARLGKNVQSAEVIRRDVWHGPWTTPPATTPSEEKP